MDTVDGRGDSGIFLSGKTGALLMVNKEERKLIKELLAMALNSESGKTYIVKKLGAEYIRIGEELLKSLG